MITNKRMHTKVSSILMLLSTLGAIMEQVNFNYSIKNIPIPSQQDFRIQMIKSVEHFVKNIRWRAFHYLNPVQTNVKKDGEGCDMNEGWHFCGKRTSPFNSAFSEDLCCE